MMEKSRICLLAGLMWTNANIGVMLDWACGGSAADGGEMDMGGFWAERCSAWSRMAATAWASTGCLLVGRCLAVDGLPGRWQLLVKADRAAEDACRRILGAVRHGGKLDRAALPVGDENGEDGGCQHGLGVMGSGEMLVGVACLGCSWWRTARSGWRAWSVRTLLGLPALEKMGF
ncbi:hypothetical protein ACLOJK_005020 [Asimina triloba]